MHTIGTLTLLVALAAPAPQEPSFDSSINSALAHLERLGPELERQGAALERELERVAGEIQRLLERAGHERERQREIAEREMARAAQRERAQTAREQERQRELAERERERQQEQAERQREQAERQREREREQADRERERARSRDGNVQEVERITRTLRIGDRGELHLSNISGDIAISRGSGSDAQVEIVKTARGQTNDDARALLKLVQVEVVERAGRAEVTAHYPRGDEMRRGNRRNVNVSVSYNVTVPAGTRVRANSISGSVSAKDVTGDLVLKSISGTVRLANAAGVCAAESISSNVEVIDSTFDGSVSASSASGTILMKRVKARRIAANSISGNVHLEGVEAGGVEGKSVSGNVQLSGPIGKSARYELGSHSGNLNVTVSGGMGFEVQATSFSGGVRSDFQFTSSNAESSRGRFPRTVRGVVGDGSAVLELSTFSGNIVINKQ